MGQNCTKVACLQFRHFCVVENIWKTPENLILGPKCFREIHPSTKDKSENKLYSLLNLCTYDSYRVDMREATKTHSVNSWKVTL